MFSNSVQYEKLRLRHLLDPTWAEKVHLAELISLKASAVTHRLLRVDNMN